MFNRVDTLPLARRASMPLLWLALVGLSACGQQAAMTAASTGALELPALASTQQPAPAPTDSASAQALLQPLADDTQIHGSDAAFKWLYWEGEVPADVPAETWSLGEFMYAKKLDGYEWDAFAAGLRSTFPGGVLVYELAEPCENCTKTLYIIEGRAAWGVGGFLGHVFYDH